MDPIINHLQITVKDIRAAEAFYDRLLPLLGFTPLKKGKATIEANDFEVVEYQHPKLAFAITSPRKAFAGDAVHRRKPGSVHHIAFTAPSRADVDRIHAELVVMGAAIVTPPREYPEYVPPGYYACFFKDPDGIKYEIVHAPHPEK